MSDFSALKTAVDANTTAVNAAVVALKAEGSDPATIAALAATVTANNAALNAVLAPPAAPPAAT